MQQQTYLTQTKHNTYRYYRRVPSLLLQYIDTSYFRISLGTDTTIATASALQFNNTIKASLQLIELGVSTEIILDKLKVLIPKKKVVSSITSKSTTKEGLFLDVVSNYLESSIDNISADETRDKRYFYSKVCPHIFKSIGLTKNPKLNNISYDDLLKFKQIILQLPKRNIQKYRTMELGSILKILDDVQQEDKLSARTINKYIKWLRALFNYSLIRGLVNVNLASAITIQKTTDDKLQRLPLSIEEIKELKSLLQEPKSYLCDVLFLSSMRLSELYKCKIETIDDIKCFTLLDRSIKLKTKSSYRVIPIHTSLLNNIDKFESYREEISSDNLAKSISKTIKKHNFKDSHKKSLYSLRHSFATELIQRGAYNILVSQLMGHSLANQGGLTLSRYAVGYNTKQLKEVIELL